ncbi:hypothetical protein HELRODRAFT_183156 [Helobdella robusta]|uniref:WSC domain-containing protein n=1 Tax=Helobdella robusta TaxID=6412 RepID=T1FJ82_HELRO|nr:hypothetical protein HELRODRAFT_183156 [Helobdella robusta]ESO11462.1 hypothetical protein HELRODRAFT_183156 [Helobdella robusta]
MKINKAGVGNISANIFKILAKEPKRDFVKIEIGLLNNFIVGLNRTFEVHPNQHIKKPYNLCGEGPSRALPFGLPMKVTCSDFRLISKYVILQPSEKILDGKQKLIAANELEAYTVELWNNSYYGCFAHVLALTSTPFKTVKHCSDFCNTKFYALHKSEDNVSTCTCSVDVNNAAIPKMCNVICGVEQMCGGSGFFSVYSKLKYNCMLGINARNCNCLSAFICFHKSSADLYSYKKGLIKKLEKFQKKETKSPRSCKNLDYNSKIKYSTFYFLNFVEPEKLLLSESELLNLHRKYDKNATQSRISNIAFDTNNRYSMSCTFLYASLIDAFRTSHISRCLRNVCVLRNKSLNFSSLLGCYKLATFEYEHDEPGLVDLECRALCFSSLYTFFGTRGLTECYCSNTTFVADQVSAENCVKKQFDAYAVYRVNSYLDINEDTKKTHFCLNKQSIDPCRPGQCLNGYMGQSCDVRGIL